MRAHSHASRWLSSIYRRILNRGRRMQQGFFWTRGEQYRRPQRRPLGGLEGLEHRVLLSGSDLREETPAQYQSNPIMTAAVATVLQQGLDRIATKLAAASGQSQFNTNIPGVLETYSFPHASGPAKAVSLTAGTDVATSFRNVVVNAITPGNLAGKTPAEVQTFLNGLSGGFLSGVTVRWITRRSPSRARRGRSRPTSSFRTAVRRRASRTAWTSAGMATVWAS
jgi:hypothetical protein